MTLFPGPSLDELREAVDACTACDLYKEATQAVFGEGPRHAALMLIGEVPGDKEDLAGRPFVGPAGKVLDEALAEVGIERAADLPHERGEALQVRAAGQGADPQEAQRGRDPRVRSVVAGRAAQRAPRGPRHPRRDRGPRRVRAELPGHETARRVAAGTGRHLDARDDPSLGGAAGAIRAPRSRNTRASSRTCA